MVPLLPTQAHSVCLLPVQSIISTVLKLHHTVCLVCLNASDSLQCQSCSTCIFKTWRTQCVCIHLNHAANGNSQQVCCRVHLAWPHTSCSICHAKQYYIAHVCSKGRVWHHWVLCAQLDCLSCCTWRPPLSGGGFVKLSCGSESLSGMLTSFCLCSCSPSTC